MNNSSLCSCYQVKTIRLAPDNFTNFTKVSTAFKQGLFNLLSELHLATKWDRPSILIAIYKSEFVKTRGENILEEELSKIGQVLKKIKIEPHESDITQTIINSPQIGRTIFSVAGVGFGGGNDAGDAYRALNLKREFLVEHRIKAIFWLTENEANRLPRLAPDFWAFRHRVINFGNIRALRTTPIPSGILLWEDQNPNIIPSSINDDIQYHRDVLAGLSGNNESLIVRIDIQYNLAYLYWFQGELDKATETVNSCLDLVKRFQLPKIGSRLLNSKAIIYYDMNKLQDAFSYINRAITEDIKSSIPLINSGIISHALGRRYDSIIRSKKAIKLEPKNPRLWNVLGFLYVESQKYEDAQFAFKKARNIEPNNINYFISQAMCYFRAGDSRNLIHTIDLAKRLTSLESIYNRACEDVLQGNVNDALLLMQKARESGDISPSMVRRDPVLHFILDPQDIQSLVK